MIKNLSLSTILLVLTISLTHAQSVIYKKVNEDGSITYADAPFPGAVEVKLGANTVTVPGTPVQANKQTKSTRQQKDYKLSIVSPANEATIRNNTGTVSIQAKLEPNLGGIYILEINGKKHQSPSGSFSLQDIDRGEHAYKVSFADTSGKVIASSETRTLFLHRASVLFPVRN